MPVVTSMFSLFSGDLIFPAPNKSASLKHVDIDYTQLFKRRSLDYKQMVHTFKVAPAALLKVLVKHAFTDWSKEEVATFAATFLQCDGLNWIFGQLKSSLYGDELYALIHLLHFICTTRTIECFDLVVHADYNIDWTPMKILDLVQQLSKNCRNQPDVETVARCLAWNFERLVQAESMGMDIVMQCQCSPTIHPIELKHQEEQEQDEQEQGQESNDKVVNESTNHNVKLSYAQIVNNTVDNWSEGSNDQQHEQQVDQQQEEDHLDDQQDNEQEQDIDDDEEDEQEEQEEMDQQEQEGRSYHYYGHRRFEHRTPPPNHSENPFEPARFIATWSVPICVHVFNADGCAQHQRGNCKFAHELISYSFAELLYIGQQKTNQLVAQLQEATMHFEPFIVPLDAYPTQHRQFQNLSARDKGRIDGYRKSKLGMFCCLQFPNRWGISDKLAPLLNKINNVTQTICCLPQFQAKDGRSVKIGFQSPDSRFLNFLLFSPTAPKLNEALEMLRNYRSSRK